jgi:CRP-like cAMP-binding protein
VAFFKNQKPARTASETQQKHMQRPAQPEIQNRLLAALPRRDYQRLSRYLEPVTLSLHQVLHEPGDPIRHIYFPESGVISLLTVVDRNKAAEVAVVGREGVVGGSATLGINISQVRALVQGEGTALQIDASRLRKECETNCTWFRELYRFSNALMGQAAQTAACNRFHTVEARLARWLLATRDRVNSRHIHLTQEFLSTMLGVRRVGITEAAKKLHKLKLITYSRGHIQLLDPARLEASACPCYGVVREIYRISYRK